MATFLLAGVALGITVGMNWVSRQMVRSPLEGARNQIVDLAFQVRTHNPLFNQITPEDIVIIDIDDASIAELGRPQLWPRGYDAMVIDYLSQGNPKAIGIDYLYPEPDTFPSAYSQMLEQRGFSNSQMIMQALSTDDMLAQSIEQSGKVYLSVFNDDNAPTDSTLRAYAPLRLISLDTTFERCEQLTHPVLPLSPFMAGAKGVGCISMPSMNDGSVRFYHALNQWPTDEKKFLPNFSLHMVKDALDSTGTEQYRFEDGALRLGDKVKMPIDQFGSFRLNWLGQEDSIRYISYYKILDERVPLEFFEGKFIFLGTSASGMQDLKTIPARADKIPGVEVHAIAFLNMSNQAFLKEFKEESSLFALYVQAFLLVLIFLIIKPLFGFVVSLALVFGQMLLFVKYIFPEFSVILPIVSMMLITIFAYLAATLYIYFIKERKSRRLKMAFSSYVSPDVVNQIAKDSSVMKLHGQKKVLSVMFSDIRGFTSYSESLEPEEVVRELNAYLSAMSERIFEFKGTIDKFMGDGIMSIFGAPLPQIDHADRACFAALSMRTGLQNFNDELLHQKGKGFEMGIGINTGAMTVGNIGSRRKFDYTVIGDSVNLGSRLESLTKYLGVDILVSESTKMATTSGLFLFRELIPVQVKGKEKPVLIFQLVDVYSEDQPELLSITLWEKALKVYQQGNARECLNLLEQLKDRWPNDVVCEMIISWCELALATGQYKEVWSPDQK